MATPQETTGMPSLPSTPERSRGGQSQVKAKAKEDTKLRKHGKLSDIKSPQPPRQQDEASHLEEETPRHSNEQGLTNESDVNQEGDARLAPGQEPSTAPKRRRRRRRRRRRQQQKQTAAPSSSPSPVQSPPENDTAPTSRPAPQSENSATSLVRYAPHTTPASPPSESGGEDDEVHGEEEDDEDAEIIPRDPRSFPQALRSPHLPPPTAPYLGFVRHGRDLVQCEYDEATETETDASSTFAQSRRRDLGREMGREVGRRRSRRGHRNASRSRDYAADDSHDEDGDGDYDDGGYALRPGHGARHGFTHGQWNQGPRSTASGFRSGLGHGYAGPRGDGYVSLDQAARSVARGTNGPWVVPYRQRQIDSGVQDGSLYDHDDGGSMAVVVPDRQGRKAPRGARSTKRQECGPKAVPEVSSRPEMRAGGRGPRLQMNLNLDVEITLKAKIQGGIEFSLL